MVGEHGRVEQVRGTERVDPERLEERGRSRLGRGRPQVREVHPELARPVVPDDPDALRRAGRGHREAEHDRLAAARSLRKRRKAAELAAGLDRDDTHARLHRRGQLLVALARSREHHVRRVEACPQDVPELTARGHVRAETEPGEVAQDGQARVRLDRVGQVE